MFMMMGLIMTKSNWYEIIVIYIYEWQRLTKQHHAINRQRTNTLRFVNKKEFWIRFYQIYKKKHKHCFVYILIQLDCICKIDWTYFQHHLKVLKRSILWFMILILLKATHCKRTLYIFNVKYMYNIHYVRLFTLIIKR